MDFDKDASQFTAARIASAPANNICDHPTMGPDNHCHAKTTNEDAENAQNHPPLRPGIAVPVDVGGNDHQPSSPWPTMTENPSDQQTKASVPIILNDRLLIHFQFEQNPVIFALQMLRQRLP